MGDLGFFCLFFKKKKLFQIPFLTPLPCSAAARTLSGFSLTGHLAGKYGTAVAISCFDLLMPLRFV